MTGRALFLLAAGYAIWALAFVVLYAMLSVGCEFGWEAIELTGGISLQRAQLVALFLLHAAAGAFLVAILYRGGQDALLISAARLTAIAALGSTLFSFFGVFFLSACN